MSPSSRYTGRQAQMVRVRRWLGLIGFCVALAAATLGPPAATAGVPGAARYQEPPIDEDGDGFLVATDCNDHDPMVNPAAYDVPGDRIDQDCDGHIALPLIAPPVRAAYSWRGTNTQFRSILVSDPGVGAKVRLSCSGSGCRALKKHARKMTASTGDLFIRRPLRHALHPQARLTVAVQTPSQASSDSYAATRYVIRRGRSPQRQDGCLRRRTGQFQTCKLIRVVARFTSLRGHRFSVAALYVDNAPRPGSLLYFATSRGQTPLFEPTFMELPQAPGVSSRVTLTSHYQRLHLGVRDVIGVFVRLDNLSRSNTMAIGLTTQWTVPRRGLPRVEQKCLDFEGLGAELSCVQI